MTAPTQELPQHHVGTGDVQTDGATLHYHVCPPDGPAWAWLAIFPGYGDHGGRHLPLMNWLASRGVAAAAVDFRGHGRSSGRSGFVSRWDEFIDDAEAFIARVAVHPPSGPPAPLFILGHSHGGLIAALGVIRGRLQPAGVILTSPFFRSLLRVSPLKAAAARAANVLVPWLCFPSNLHGQMMSSDPEMIRDSDSDPLLLHTATPRWYFQTLKAQAEALRRAPEFKLPLLCLTGGRDPIADAAAAANFCDHAGSADKQLKVYPSRLHELLRETGREEIFGDILEWMRGRSPVGSIAGQSGNQPQGF